MTPIRNTKLLGPYDEKAELISRNGLIFLKLCSVILGGSRESLVMLVWFKALLHLKSLDGVKNVKNVAAVSGQKDHQRNQLFPVDKF